LTKSSIMKKILSIIGLLGLGSAAMAQDIKIGPEVGAALTTMSQNVNGTDYSTNYQLGFRAGGTIDIQFNQSFSLQSGVYVSTNNGTESNYTRYYKTGAGIPSSETDRRKYGITYLSLPVYALFKTGTEYYDDPHFFVGIGPSFNVGVGGGFKREYTYTTNGIGIPTTYNNDVSYGNDRVNNDLRRFDMSANVTVGYEMPVGVFFRAYYGVGLLNLAPGGGADNAFRNSGGGISIGYFFNVTNRPRY